MPQAAKKSSAWIVVAVVVIVVALVIVILLGSAAIFSGVSGTPVRVTGVSWTISYSGSTSGYFGPSPQSVCSACPFTQSAGSRFTYTLSIQSSAILLTHSIDSVTISAPFNLVLISPSLPISVSPGGTATMTFTIQVPSQGGSYVLDGTINTH